MPDCSTAASADVLLGYLPLPAPDRACLVGFQINELKPLVIQGQVHTQTLAGFSDQQAFDEIFPIG